MPFSVMCSSIEEAIFSSDSGLGCLGTRFTEISSFISYPPLRGRFVPPDGKNNFFCRLLYPRRSSFENPVASCSTLTRGHGALRVVTNQTGKPSTEKGSSLGVEPPWTLSLPFSFGEVGAFPNCWPN